MATHNELGKKGEKLGCKYLISKGYTIKEENWRNGRFELDIVAENEEYIVFIEVKTRSNNYFGNPQEFVSESKVKRIINAANHYMISNSIEKETRFDIISILKTSEENFTIEHIENAFVPASYY